MAPRSKRSDKPIDKPHPRQGHIILCTLPSLIISTRTHSLTVQLTMPTELKSPLRLPIGQPIIQQVYESRPSTASSDPSVRSTHTNTESEPLEGSDRSTHPARHSVVSLTAVDPLPYTDDHIRDRFHNVAFQIERLDRNLETAKGNIDKRFDNIDERFEKVDERFKKVDERFDAMQKQMDRRFDAMQKQTDGRFDAMQKQTDGRFDAMQKQTDRRFDVIEKQMDKIFSLLQQQRTPSPSISHIDPPTSPSPVIFASSHSVEDTYHEHDVGPPTLLVPHTSALVSRDDISIISRGWHEARGMVDVLSQKISSTGSAIKRMRRKKVKSQERMRE